jgi:hypothetical protein
MSHEGAEAAVNCRTQLGAPYVLEVSVLRLAQVGLLADLYTGEINM